MNQALKSATTSTMLGLTTGILGGMAIDELLKDRLTQIIAGASDAVILIIVAVIAWKRMKAGEQ